MARRRPRSYEACVRGVPLIALAWCIAACGKDDTQHRGDSPGPDSAGLIITLPAETAMLVPPAPVPGGARPNIAALMLGTWEVAPTAGGGFPLLTLVIDSAQGSSFSGRMTRALSGDVEL